MGILIAVDGVDASGKQTQTEMLYERLVKEGRRVRLVSFPAYDSPSSSLVRMYLNGEFGSNPEDVSAYAASSFFAADRFATYKTDWGKDYNSDTIIIADRYVSSNMIHQAGKIKDKQEKDRFLSWLDGLEYGIYSLPRPDKTIFLDMPVEWGIRLMAERANKITGGEQKDIHEGKTEYLRASYDNAVYAAEKFGWERIVCAGKNGVRSIEDIHEEMYKAVKRIIEGRS